MKLFLFTLLVAHTACAHEVLTITQPILDHVVFVDERFLATVPGEKGGREMVSEKDFAALLEKCGSVPIRSPGGSSANVMKGLAQLGHDTSAIGKVGRDLEGFYYTTELERLGVSAYMLFSSLPTGKSAILVTPDGERTMRTALGAAADTKDYPLDETLFDGTRLFHMEGYMLFDKPLVFRAIQLAKKHNALISLDLSSFEVARIHKEFLLTYLKDHVDVLFANQEEARALTDLDAEEACNALSAHFPIVVVTMGKEGCWVQKQQERHRVPGFAVNTLDSTGAGDCFASGFLHGYLNSYPVSDCAWIGNLVASQVVEVVGAHIPEERWAGIRTTLEAKELMHITQLTQELAEGH